MASSAGDISRENLERHGIIYDEKVYAGDHQDAFSNLGSSLPGHVDALKEALLAFSSIVPDDWKEVFDDEFKQYDSEILEKDCLQPSTAAYLTQQRYELRRPSPESKAAHKNNERCKKIAEAARKRAKEAEAGWTHFLRKNVFRDFDEENNSRTEIDLLFDQWSLQENFLWNEFQDWQKPIPHFKRRTDPKPDLTYGFPIISSPEGLPEGFVKDEYIQSFSLDVLGKLRSNGVHSATTTGLRRWAETKNGVKLKAPDLLCYPWAIVEMKHSQVSSAEVEKCYCQAANASAAALSLQEQLLALAFGTIPRTLSPIIAFTCIGPRIKVWLTYRWKGLGKKFIKMSCIWSTSLELTWGVVALRRIVQSMHFWSSRILKPKIAVALSQMREKIDNAVPLTMRTSQDHRFLLVSTSPATPSSSRNRQRSRTRSPSVQSHQADGSRSDDNTTLVDSSTELSGTEDDGNEEEDDSGSDDESDSSDNKSNTSGSEDVTFNDQIFSSDDENEYAVSETSEMESDDGNSSDSEDDSCKRKIGFKYTVEELQDRGRLSLTLLSGVKFAKLGIIDEWFEDLPFQKQVKVVWKLLDPSNGGLLQLTRVNRNQTQRVIDTLNEALNKDEPDTTALTLMNLGKKKSGACIRRGLRNLRSEPETLKVCLRRCLRLHNDKTCSIHDIIGDDLKTLSDENIEEMEKQAFESLNKGDQETDLLP